MKLRILIVTVRSNSQTVSEKVYCQKGNSPKCELRPQIKIRSGSSIGLQKSAGVDIEVVIS